MYRSGSKRGLQVLASLLLAALLSSGSANAEPAGDITVVGPQFTDLIEPGGSGHYQVLLQEAALRANVSYIERVLPQKRAYEEFVNGDADCIYDYTVEAQRRLGTGAVIASYPLHPFRLHIFTGIGAEVISDPQQLIGKKVGGVLGHEEMYSSVLPEEVQVEYVPTDRANVGKLKRGRLDAILGFMPDMSNYIYALSFDVQQPLFERFDRMTCRSGEHRRSFLRAISDQLEAMHEDGTMARIMGPHTMQFQWQGDELMP